MNINFNASVLSSQIFLTKNWMPHSVEDPDPLNFHVQECVHNASGHTDPFHYLKLYDNR